MTYTNGAGGPTLGKANNEVVLVNPGVLTQGLSSTTQAYTLSNNEALGGGRVFDVWTTATDHYSETSGPNLVTLVLPGKDYVTGGGHYVMSNTTGKYAETSNAKMNFGYTMKWNKSGKNLQGQINVTFRRWQLFQGVWQWRVYQIKSNAINSMTVRLEDDYNKAVINTKATLNDITVAGASISYDGGHDLTLEAWDYTKANGGELPRIGVQLIGNNNSEQLFASA